MGEDTSREELAAKIGRLIGMATRSEQIGELLAAGSAELRRPLAIVDANGAHLAGAPATGRGREAFLAAQAAARRGGGRGAGQTAWLIRPVLAGEQLLGYVSVGGQPQLTGSEQALLDALCSLFAGQLQRAALATAVCAERARALRRRLITDPGLTPAAAAEQAHIAGIALADRYWPAILVCEAGELDEVTLRGIADLAQRFGPESVVVPFDDRMAVVLLPDVAPGRQALPTLEHMVRLARGRPALHGVHGIAGETSVGLPELPAVVRSLERLRRYPQHESGALSVVDAGRFALNRLFHESLDRPYAAEFVRAQVGPIIAYDREHHTDLAETLQAALDHPNRDEAARAVSMHRNTFRRHLKQAITLVGIDLDDPDERLALHVALRLRRLLAIDQPSPGGSDRASLNPSDPAAR